MPLLFETFQTPGAKEYILLSAHLDFKPNKDQGHTYAYARHTQLRRAIDRCDENSSG